MYKKIMVLSVVLISMMMWTNVWSQTTSITLTASPSQTVSYNVCAQQYTQAILYAPLWASSGISWEQGSNEYWQDSLIVTPTSNEGIWIFHSSQGNVIVNINFVSGPTEPWTASTTNTCGTLHAQISPQPGMTYLWSTGATTESIVATSPGIYSVSVTSDCGNEADSIEILWTGPVLELGPTDTVCYTTTLNPGSFSSYLWSNATNLPTLTVTTNGTYGVTITNSGGCIDEDSVYIQVDTARTIETCDVTYDTLTNKNSINHYVDPTETEITDVVIHVKDQLGVFVALDTIPYIQESYIDWGSNPQADYSEYYLTAITHCGEGPASTINRSIWLTTLTNELQWQNYYGSFTPPYYIVFARMVNGSVVPIDTVPACSGSGCLNHSLIVNNPNIAKYFVAFEHTCSTNKTNGWVRSNYLDIITTSTHEVVNIPFSVYPNPASDQLIINIGIENFQVEILTMLGQVVLTEHNVKTLDVSNLNQGVYIISVTANGVQTNKIITKH